MGPLRFIVLVQIQRLRCLRGGKLLHDMLRLRFEWIVPPSLMRRVVRISPSWGRHRWLLQAWSPVPKRVLRWEKMLSPQFLHLFLPNRIQWLIDGVSRACRLYLISAYNQRGKGRLYDHFTRSPNWLILDWTMSPDLRKLWHFMGSSGWLLRWIISL